MTEVYPNLRQFLNGFLYQKDGPMAMKMLCGQRNKNLGNSSASVNTGCHAVLVMHLLKK